MRDRTSDIPDLDDPIARDGLDPVQQEEVEASEAVDPDGPAFGRPQIDTRAEEFAYATKDNIVHPGPPAAAAHASAVAKHELGEQAEVALDPSQPVPEDLELPENPTPIQGPR